MKDSSIIVNKIDLLYKKIKNRKEKDNASSSNIYKSLEERAS